MSRFGWLSRSATARSGAIILAVMILISFAAPLLAPHSPYEVDPEARLMPPMSHLILANGRRATFILGTDAIGHDVLSRVMFGGRLSLTVGIAAVVLSAAFGSLVGSLSGFFGGWVEGTTAWLIDVQLSFPFLLLAIFLLGALGGGLPAVILILAMGTWVNYARIVRGQILSLKTRTFVEAARATGAGPWRVLLIHILPNTLSPVSVLASFSMAQAILTEAGLSFIGVGLDPSTPSWGTILNDGRDYLVTAWWIATAPGIAIAITVLGVTLLGEGLRDVLDPRSGS